MQTERSDKFISQQLDGMETLPAGVRFNSQELWTGIEQQLHPSKRRSYGWYYAAAAILLMFGSVSFHFFFQDKKTIEPLQVASAPKISLKTLPQKPTIAVKQIAPISSHHAQVQKADLKITSEAVAIKETESLSPIVAEVPITTTLLAEPVPAANTSKQLVIKKKLKIIHYNDLNGEPVLSSPSMPSKRLQAKEEFTDDETSTPANKPWWQPKPKPIIISTLSDNK